MVLRVSYILGYCALCKQFVGYNHHCPGSHSEFIVCNKHGEEIRREYET